MDGWVSHLVRTLRAILFDYRWDPALRLALLAIVGVVLFLAVRTYG
jgi:succinate dehydrogenase hydrophobic anchor subunit